MRARSILACGSMVLVACSLAVDTSGLSGGPRDAGTYADATVDAASGDASREGDAPPSDAGGDAARAADADAGDAAVSRWCARYPDAALCDDFDEPTSGSFAKWDGLLRDTPSLTVDSDASSSPPSSFLVFEPAGSGPNQRGCLYRHMPGAVGSVRLAADVIAESTDSASFVEVLKIALQPAPSGYGEYNIAIRLTSANVVQLTNYATILADGGSINETVLPMATSFNAWTRVQLELVFGSPPFAKAYDGAGALLAQIKLPAASSEGEDVLIGMPYIDQTVATPWIVHEDNVVITSSP